MRCNKIKNKIVEILHIMIKFRMILAFVILSLLVYVIYINDVKHYKEEKIDGADNTYILEIGALYGEQFVSKYEELAEYWIDVENLNIVENGDISYFIRDLSTNDIIYANSVPIREAVYDNNLRFCFYNQFRRGGVKLNVGGEYEVLFVIPNSVEINAYGVCSKKEGFSLNGIRLDYSLCRNIVYNNSARIKVLFWGIEILLLFMIALVQILCNRNESIERVFIPITIFIGLVLMILFPPGNVEDESSHLLMSMEYSSPIKENFWAKDSGNFCVRESDISTIELLDNHIFSQISSIDYIYSYFDETIKDYESTSYIYTNLSSGTYFSPNSTGNILLYFPNMVALVIGRFIGLNLAKSIILARILNYLSYCILSYYAIKLFCLDKRIMLLTTTLPTSLHFAASLSYDAIGSGICFMYISCLTCLIYKKDCEIKKIDYILYFIFSFLLGFTKGGFYVLLGILGIIPIIYRRKKPIWRSFIELIIPLCGLVTNMVVQGGVFGEQNIIISMIKAILGFFYKTDKSVGTNLLSAPARDIVAVYGGEKCYSFSELIRNPLSVLMIFFRTLFENGGKWSKTLFGGALNWESIQLPDIFPIFAILLFSLLLYENVINLTRNRYASNKNETKIRRIVCVVTIFMIVFAAFFMMLLYSTHRGAEIVNSVRPRYFLPLLPIMLIYIGNKDCNCDGTKMNNFISIYSIFCSLLLLRIFYSIAIV